MKNTLVDLNNALFAELEGLQDEDVTREELDAKIKRSEAVTKIAEKIIQNGQLALRTVELMNEYGYNNSTPAAIPEMLVQKNDPKKR